MDYGRTGDIEGARLAQAGVVATGNEHNLHAQEAPYGTSTPLLRASISNNDDSGPAEQQGTSSSEPQSIPHALAKGLFLFFISMLPFIIILASWIYLVTSEIDPLGFSFLSFLLVFSLAVSAIAIALLSPIIRWATLRLLDILGTPAQRPDRDEPMAGIMVFMYGLLVIYLVFYGTACIWATSRPVDDLLDNHGVYHDFLAKVHVPDALAVLTRCLYDSAPGRFATVKDFSKCLKDIGVESG